MSMSPEEREIMAEDSRRQWLVPFIRAQLCQPNFGQRLQKSVHKQLRRELKIMRESPEYIAAIQSIRNKYQTT